MLDVRMKDLCRICARELCGNQRRWIFHPASKLNLQVLLSHVLGRDLTRDGRAEFACSKCTFMLERMYRFDTVIARVEALSIERLQKLLLEKERLRQCIGSLYSRSNSEEMRAGAESRPVDCTVDMSGLHDAKYVSLLQEDLAYSAYESWAEHEDQVLDPHHHCQGSEACTSRSRRCKGCSALRVADSDYEAVCRVPRKLARSISCGPSTRYSVSVPESEYSVEPSAAVTPVLEGDSTAECGSLEDTSSGSPSVESLDTAVDAVHPSGHGEEEQRSEQMSASLVLSSHKLALALSLVRNCEYRPIQSPRGSRLPILVKPTSLEMGNKEAALELSARVLCSRCSEVAAHQVPLDLQLELAELEEMWRDVYVEYAPIRCKKSLIEEQQSQLNQYECAAGQCVSELQKAQLQVQSLQARIHKSESNNKKLQEKLNEMELELRSLRQSTQMQERTIQGLNDVAGTKDREAQELYSVIEGQNEMLCTLKEVAHRYQLQHLQVSDREATQLQTELLALRSSIFSSQLELQGSKRAERKSQWQAADISRARDRLHADLEEALQHRESTEQHNQELRSALHQAQSDLQAKEVQLKEVEGEKQVEVEAREKTMQQLRLSLQTKEQMVQEYLELLDHQKDPSKNRDTMLHKLKERIKERDRTLERAIDDKFHCLEEKNADIRHLQLALREKERDLERLRYVLSKNEETITSLEGVLRGRELELEQAKEANKNLQWLKHEVEERNRHSLKERDAIISQLQASLQSRTKEAENLTAALLSKSTTDGNLVVEELKLRLQLKERLFQEALSDRTRQAQEHHSQVQELLGAINSRDQYIKDSVSRLGQVIAERTCELQELRRQLAVREQELTKLTQKTEQQSSDPHYQIKRLQNQLREKESFIQVLMNSNSYNQEEPMITSKQGEASTGTGQRAADRDLGLPTEICALHEELRLALKKEKEAQLELSTLRAALAKVKDQIETQAVELEGLTKTLEIKEELIKDLQRQLVHPSDLTLVEGLTQELQELRDREGHQKITSKDHQLLLEQLISDYGRLNEAVKVEKQVYHSLMQVGSIEDSSEKVWTLQRELDTIQALRGQLEEALGRARETTTLPEKAAATQPEFGELDVEEEEEEEEEDDGSSEYADSIEDEENSKLTARSLAANQTSFEKLDLHTGATRAVSSQSVAADSPGLAEVQQLVEQKKAVERELGELKTQLEKAGYASLSQMRNAALSLRAENGELKRALAQAARRMRGKAEPGGLADDGRSGIPEKEEDERGQAGEGEGLADNGREPGVAHSKRSISGSPLREGRGKRRCTRPVSLDLGSLPSHTSTQEAELKEQARRLRSDLERSQQESQELQERLMVSEATVQAQAEQLKDYRELLTETSVQQHSKQVQVDLQDLGYETCGRSENEAEREDASSPEFDDLEMCTTLSRQDCGARWWAEDSGKGEHAASLQRQVEDLRSQLSRSHAAIRSLQGRLRLLSNASDYGSGPERPHKVSWGLRGSPATSGPEEDEGWQSEGPAAPSRPPPSRELRELASRVASLEDQLKVSRAEGKGAHEDPKTAAWQGKFDTLIQAQARELSHLRQRMRVGRGVCHILSQHLGDTTKAFEELLRANDVDYYMGQSFRQQLAQSLALAERVAANIGSRDPVEVLDDKMGHELLALRLSKELQQKDKLIESLRSKLKQQRPDTPSSSHALSETTNQSDRTSFVSDEPGSAHEDLELGSELDMASEYTQEEQDRGRSPLHAMSDSLCPGGTPPLLSSIPSSISPSHGPQSPTSCLSMPRTSPKLVDSHSQKELFIGPMSSSLPCSNLPGLRVPLLFDPRSPLVGSSHCDAGSFSLAEVHQELQALQRQLADSFAVPHMKPLSAFPPAQPNPAGYIPLSHHAFHQPSLSTPNASTPNASTAVKPEANLLDRSALWDMTHIGQPTRAGAYRDISSGSSGYQSGASHTGSDLIEEHLREIRSLRQRLEDSIQTNDRLRQQLEERLATTGRDGGAPTNIYIQGLDSVSQLTNENRALKAENLDLQAQLKASRDSCKECTQLREVILSGRVRLKQVELEAERWREENQRLQTLGCEQEQEIQQLRQERQMSQDYTNRLKHEVNLLEQQLSENRQLLRSLQCELQLYEQVCRTAKSNAPAELTGLLEELRSLRMQLERSMQENGSLRAQLEQQLSGLVTPSEPRPSNIGVHGQQDNSGRRQLFHDPAPSPPVRDPGLLNADSPYSTLSKSPELEDSDILTNDLLKPHSELEGEAPDGSFANKNGRHAVGHVDDFNALQQQILEGEVLVHKMEVMLQSSLNSGKALDHGLVKNLLTSTKTLHQILEEATSLLKMFWRAALPSTESSFQFIRKEQSMKDEIRKLRVKISEQEGLLKDTIERLRRTNRSKESMELFIVSQLSRTRDVLKKARTNLEVKSRGGVTGSPFVIGVF
ncbi:myomegalin isoform X3 [Scleropages formosus]|uniref:myomegalin isoform X3 n=1 Tax=Scleropages formosus TaxID=113540 RepID=UPI0010FA9C0F|nr:myomegalin-like isoform X3 [Scleropages formosus]